MHILNIFGCKVHLGNKWVKGIPRKCFCTVKFCFHNNLNKNNISLNCNESWIIWHLNEKDKHDTLCFKLEECLKFFLSWHRITLRKAKHVKRAYILGNTTYCQELWLRNMRIKTVLKCQNVIKMLIIIVPS